MTDERAIRLARNEARFREINERSERDLQRVVEDRDELLEFICECGHIDCAAVVRLSIAEYEGLRRDAAQFAVLPGHEIEDVEDVVERHGRYFIVRKRPETRPIAVEADPRS